MKTKIHLSAIALVASMAAGASLAADPASSTPSGARHPETRVPAVQLPTPTRLPSPTDIAGFPQLPPPPPGSPRDLQAADDEAVDAVIMLGLLGQGPDDPAAAPVGAPTSIDLMVGICNAAGGGASSNPDGTTSCVSPDGEDVLPPVPTPSDD